MWRQVQIELPAEVANDTTSIWQYDDVVQVGIMRRSFLRPPVLWAQVLRAGLRNLRRAKVMLDELQTQLVMPVVYAETLHDAPANQAFLEFIGFEELPEKYERKLYQRSI